MINVIQLNIFGDGIFTLKRKFLKFYILIEDSKSRVEKIGVSLSTVSLLVTLLSSTETTNMRKNCVLNLPCVI